MPLKFGLTDDHIEELRNGQTVTFEILDGAAPGHNEIVEIELTDLDDVGRYDNLLDLYAARDR